jgi:hypothetical protein
MKEQYVLYYPKGNEMTLTESHDYLKLQHELELKGYDYIEKQWGKTFDQVNKPYTPTIDVYEDGGKTIYTVDFFNTYDKIKAGHFAETL